MLKLNMCNKQRQTYIFVTSVFLVLFDLTPSVPNFDAPYYMLAGQHIFEGGLDCLRTPIYPALLYLMQLILGKGGVLIGMTIIQSLVYLISAQSLVRIINRVIKNQNIGLFTAFFYVAVIAPAWCNEIATESLSISGCVILVDWLLRNIDNPSIKRLLFIHCILLLLIFLRPTFILFFAVFPCVWIYLGISQKRIWHNLIALLLTIMCVWCFAGYEYLYADKYGKFSSTISFECNAVYNLKRSGCWDLKAVSNVKARKVCKQIDDTYTCNYDPIYQVVDTIPNALPLLSSACNDMIQAHKQQYNLYRIETILSSFDSRFPGAINTKSLLGSILYVWTIFLALPLSLFYLIVSICVSTLVIHLIKYKSIPLPEAIIIAVVTAQAVGIACSASEAHARLILPVYGLFVVLLGMGIDKIMSFLQKISENK